MSACGGDVDGPDCSFVNGDGVRADTRQVCTGCTVKNAPRAVDGDPGTHAEVAFAKGAVGDVVLRFQAPPDVVFPGGSVGVLLSVDDGEIDYARQIELRPYRRGAQLGSNIGTVPEVTSVDGVHKLAYTTPVEYDALEVQLRSTGAAKISVRLHEFCGT